MNQDNAWLSCFVHGISDRLQQSLLRRVWRPWTGHEGGLKEGSCRQYIYITCCCMSHSQEGRVGCAGRAGMVKSGNTEGHKTQMCLHVMHVITALQSISINTTHMPVHICNHSMHIQECKCHACAWPCASNTS